MSSRLHILTACSRPENLGRVAESIMLAALSGRHEVCWHVRFDLRREHVGGQKLKNDMLDQIRDGWVAFLDDDTLLDSDLPPLLAEHPRADAIVVSQRRANGQVLLARRENLRVGSVDIGQAVIRRDVIGDARIPCHYEGDGVFLADVLGCAPGVVFVDRVASRHNALEWVPA